MRSLLLAYVGPETVVPVTSALAAIGGALLMGWSYVKAFLRYCFRSVLGRGATVQETAEADD